MNLLILSDLTPPVKIGKKVGKFIYDKRLYIIQFRRVSKFPKFI